MADIAIIGMSGIFPQADNIEQFWKNLCGARECMETLTDEELERIKTKHGKITDFSNYVRRVSVLNHSDMFEPEFFGYSKREIEMTDPQQRLFLECSFCAFEDAGYNPDKVKDIVGVFGGESFDSYMFYNLYSHREYFNSSTTKTFILHSNSSDYLTTRVSYKLNLTGPSINVQTACSTSLVAVHEACESLLSYECDMALAGGSTVLCPEREGYFYEEGGIVSKTGHCKPFDSECDGTIFGSGTGVVLLKRLNDAKRDKDHIYAVIKGTAINNDGASKVGYAAPSIEGQQKVILSALDMAEVNPEDVSYIETHGTGTKVGDPIEITALTNAFLEYTDKKEYCGIGSVKSNLGHLNAAAGVTALIKTALMLAHKTLVPTINYHKINPFIDIKNTPFYICDQKKEWVQKEGLRYAGISSFGMGGTNAHVVLSEGPEECNRIEEKQNVMVFSARTRKSLFANIHNIKNHLMEYPDISLESVAFTLQTGRREHGLRAVIAYQGRADLIQQLTDNDIWLQSANLSELRPVFMFTGQGSQYINMVRGLLKQSQYFRKEFERCRQLFLENTKMDMFQLLYETDAAQLMETKNTQMVLFTVEYSMAKLLMEFGIVPKAMIGHSIGEYVAACLAQVFTLEDAIKLVSERGRIMEEAERGTMYAVDTLLDAASIPEQVNIAAINTADSCVISGESSILEGYVKQLSDKGFHCKKLHTSHAFHSNMMKGAAERFLEVVRSITMHAPKKPYISNVTGCLITEEQVKNPQYWADHLCNTVLFYKGLESLVEKECNLFIEVGPGNTLCNFVRKMGSSPGKAVSMIPHPKDNTDDYCYWLKHLGQLWSYGQFIEWNKLYEVVPYKISLPPYEFDKTRCWIEPKEELLTDHDTAKDFMKDQFDLRDNSELSRENISNDYEEPVTALEKSVEEIWAEVLGYNHIGIHDNFFEIGGNSLIITQIVSRIKDKFMIDLDLEYMFKNPTISVLSEYIEKELQQKIENMTEEDALKMLELLEQE